MKRMVTSYAQLSSSEEETEDYTKLEELCL